MDITFANGSVSMIGDAESNTFTVRSDALGQVIVESPRFNGLTLIDQHRLVTTELFLRGPAYVDIWISIGVDVEAGRSLAVTYDAVRAALAEHLAPLGTAPDGTGGWPLGKAVQRLELELPWHRAGTMIEVAGQALLLRGETVWVDGRAKRLIPAPYAVLRALAARPGRVVSRAALLAYLPRGQAASEHAVDMAVCRLRNVLGASLVETVVKRGYRLPVGAS